jgi:signal transduction histidine kinase
MVAATLAATAVSAVIGISLLDPLHLRASGARTAIETAITLSALVSAVLLWARFSHTRLLRELLLLAALATVALTDFVFSCLPALGDFAPNAYGAGPRLTCSLLVASAFVAAAFASPDRRVPSNHKVALPAAGTAIGAVAVGAMIDLLVHTGVGQGAGSAYEPLLTLSSIGTCIGLLVAGLHFAVLRRTVDEDAGLLSAACVLLACAMAQRLVLGFVPADWITPAEFLRCGAYGLLVLVALRLWGRTHVECETHALNTERSRIARDLHDGLAQDLAFIAIYADSMAKESGPAHPVAIAARRALAVSRGAIVDLEASEAPTIEAALREVAAELESRYNVEISVGLEHADAVDPDHRQRRALVRICREAAINAIRHGGARRVTVTYGSRLGELMLRVGDDGCGLDESRAKGHRGTGLGTAMMRARAQSLGGQLSVRRNDQGGTEIKVIAPVRTALREPTLS